MPEVFEELLSYKEVTCTIVFVSSSNFTKILDGIHQKNHGEHLLIEAAEDKVEVNVSKDTMELSEDQGDLMTMIYSGHAFLSVYLLVKT